MSGPITPLSPLDPFSPTFKDDVDEFFATKLPAFSAEANAAAVAMNLNATNDTSATSNDIDTGPKTFTVSTGKSFLAGMYLVIADTADPSTNSMWGTVTSYSGTSLVMRILATRGSGNKSAWTISQSAPGAVSAATKSDIINGQFRIHTNGIGFTGPAFGTYILDGWKLSGSGTAVGDTIQTNGVIPGQYKLKYEVTTADASIGATEWASFQTRIPGYDCIKYIGNTFVIGFTIEAPTTGVCCVSIFDGTSSYISEVTISAANTPEYKTIIIAGGLQTVANLTTGAGLFIHFTMACGSSLQNTSNTWHTGEYYGTASQINALSTIGYDFAIQNVTMNLGTVPVLSGGSYEDDERTCLRYARALTNYRLGYIYTANNLYAGTLDLSPQMNTAPTLAAGAAYTASSGANGTVTLASSATDSVRFYNAGTDWTPGAAVTVTCLLEARL